MEQNPLGKAGGPNDGCAEPHNWLRGVRHSLEDQRLWSGPLSKRAFLRSHWPHRSCRTTALSPRMLLLIETCRTNGKSDHRIDERSAELQLCSIEPAGYLTILRQLPMPQCWMRRA